MNTFGNRFRVEIFGESHGPCVGVTLDGVPSGISLKESDLSRDIDRRRPSGGNSGASCLKAFCTSREEPDTPRIMSGVYKGNTTGAPITIIFDNGEVKSGDYRKFGAVPRPGHADFTASERFAAFNDPRGGGHFSGRLTLPVVAAGVVAKKLIAEMFSKDEFAMSAKVVRLGGSANPKEWEALLQQAQKEGDSLGAVVECTVKIPAGFGDPFWNSMESLISHAVFSIPGVRGIEFGDGFAASAMRGSEHNDPFGPDGKPARNGSGGLNGGITNGAPIVFRVAFKPTSSIAREQTTLNFETGQMTALKCTGRHDVCFALRTPVVVEAMTAIVLANMLL